MWCFTSFDSLCNSSYSWDKINIGASLHVTYSEVLTSCMYKAPHTLINSTLKCHYIKQSKVLRACYCSNVVAEGAAQGEFPS